MLHDFDANTTPQDAVAALSLTAGTPYAVFNASTKATAFYRPGDTLADADTRAFRVEPNGWGYFEFDSGEVVSVWTDDPDGCPCIISEAV